MAKATEKTAKKSTAGIPCTMQHAMTQDTSLFVKKDAKILDIMLALIQCHRDHRKRVASDRTAAKNMLERIDKIVGRIEFIRDCAGKRESVCDLSGSGMGITLSRMLRVIREAVEVLAYSAKGLMAGQQSGREIDYLAEFLEAWPEKTEEDNA